MKHTVTNLNDVNEPVMFSNSIMGNLCFDTFFGKLYVDLSPFVNSYMQSKLLPCTQIVEHNCILVDVSSTRCNLELTYSTLWSLYSESSRNKDGAVVGCLLIDPHGN